MPYTVHTLDGQAHTYPGPCAARITDAGLLTLHEDGAYDEDYGGAEFGPLLAAYPAGEWTHYRIEPAPYDTDCNNTDEDRGEQGQAVAPKEMTPNAEAWATQFKSLLDAGRKAARAR